MHHFILPTYKTPEEVKELRRNIIANSSAINKDQALEWFDEDPNVEFDWISTNDVFNTIGLSPQIPAPFSDPRGWLYKRGEKHTMEFDGKEIEIVPAEPVLRFDYEPCRQMHRM